MHYFDHNATTPMLREARETWLEAVDLFPGNPSSLHRIGDRAERAMNDAREELAGLLGCQPGEIVWTSGATESCNTVLRSFADDPTCVAWTSAIEHPCMDLTARTLFKRRHRHVPVRESGSLDLERLRTELGRRRPGFVAAMAANNETGVKQPWPEIRELCRDAKVPLVCDATQWLGKEPAAGLGECEFVIGSGHKFGGPRGVGFLKVAEGRKLASLIHGGSQEDGRRAGTENVPAILAMLRSLVVREKQLAGDGRKERAGWRDEFERAVVAKLKGSRVVGGDGDCGGDRLWNTSLLIMPEADCRQRWVVKLDKAGFAVSSGSACASGREEPSHVLRAMDLSPEESARALRFSANWESTEADWLALREGLLGVAKDLLPDGQLSAAPKRD